jgi:hypothetical protein
VIERRIADLFAATRDSALSIDDITNCAYRLAGRRPSRKQRLSATRAAHRLLRRVREMEQEVEKLCEQKKWNTTECRCLFDEARRIGLWGRTIRAGPGRYRNEYDHWCATSVECRLWFHPPDLPVRVWAVSIQPAGVIWADAEVVRVTERRVVVRYEGVTAILDRRKLWAWWSFWRGVMFVSSRTGRIAAKLDKIWQERYARAGAVPAAMQMSLAEAIALLGVAIDYTLAEVASAFRKAVKQAHPDAGGTAEMFHKLVEARDRLLAALGTSAPQPKPPTYAAAGMRVVYRRRQSRQASLPGSSRRLLA